MSQRLFEGLKVIDCASYIAGPAAATALSDFGAEVVKIEPPGAGDPYRTRAQPPSGTRFPENPNWMVDSRNKKSLALDLASEAGRGVLHRLVAGADVFITNYPPKVRRRLRLDYAELAPLNPRLIYASFTGFGERGPDADKPGFDATAWWARSGIMDLARTGDTPPTRPPPGMGGHPSAMSLYAAIVTALYKRVLTGRGSHVGSSLLMNGLWANACSVQAALCGEQVERQPERSRSSAPWRIPYLCKDGRWLLLSIVPDAKRWVAFRAALHSDLLDDPRFAVLEDRKRHATALIAALDRVFAAKTLAEWSLILDAGGVVFGAVAAMADVAQDEQALASGALVAFAEGKLLTVSSPFWIEGEDKLPPGRAPAVGEHSDAILAAAGYAEADIRKLRTDGVIG